MAKEKPVEISVATVFDGKRDDRQAFIELILYKLRTADSAHVSVKLP